MPTYSVKRIVLDFDAGFNLADVAGLSSDAKSKSIKKIVHDIDSLNDVADSIGRANYAYAKMAYFHLDSISKRDSLRAVKMAATKAMNTDTLFNRMDKSRKQQAIGMAVSSVGNMSNDLEFKSMLSQDLERSIRLHKIEGIGKFTLALSCLIFFFIGAPLGAIIRKGGLGIPVIISVLVFIIYYICDNTGYRMARLGAWPVWLGKSIATAVLTPMAVFFTYKANNDSTVFSMDAYVNFFRRLLGLRLKRHIDGKEVIIQDPHYANDAAIKVFFKYEPDHEIERISDEMEAVIEDLSNTRDKLILTEINHYPILSVKAHTRPFEHRWMNIAAFILLPIGIFLYIRMWSFRLRLLRDLRTIKQTNTNIVNRINEVYINKV